MGTVILRFLTLGEEFDAKQAFSICYLHIYPPPPHAHSIMQIACTVCLYSGGKLCKIKTRMFLAYALYVFKLLALITQLLYNALVQAQHSCRFGCIACSVHLR